jgi:hypothetical protein
MANVALNIQMVDAGFVAGIVDQIWHRSLNRTIQTDTQSITQPGGTYWDWSWEFPFWPAVPDPLVSGLVNIYPSGVTVPLLVVQPNYLTIWVSGLVSGVTYQMDWWVERESGIQETNTAWLSLFGNLPPPIQ